MMLLVQHLEGPLRRGARETSVADVPGPSLGFSGFLRATPTPTLVADATSGRVLVANEPMAALVGVPSAELAGRPAGWLLHDPEAGALVTDAVRDGTATTLERRLRSRTVVRHGRVQVTPMGGVAVVQVAETTLLWDALESVTAERDGLDEMAGLMAHKLKTPLTAIVGMAELIQSDQVTEETRHEFAERIIANAMRAAETATEIADQARQTLGATSTSTRVGPLMAAVRTQLTVPVAEAGAAVRFRSDLDAVPVASGTLRTLLTTLLTVALDRRRPGVKPEIKVSIDQDAGHLRVEVTDNGVALGHSEIDELSGPNTELPVPDVASDRLGACRALLRDLGGDLWAEPQDPDGTRMIAVVPMDGTEPAAIETLDLDRADEPG